MEISGLVKKDILTVGVTDASEKQILEYVFDVLKKSKKKLSIVTPNPEIVMYARRHKAYLDTLNQADISLCDGVGLFKAGQLLGTPIKERISGVDFMEKLCKESVRNAVTVGFLGGRNGVAEKAAECLMKKYPGLLIKFIGEDWDKDGFDLGKKYLVSSISYSEEKKEIPNTKYQIQTTDAVDILFVAFGFPKQEEWIAGHLEKLPVRVMMGVGGSFDYLSGKVTRAPRFMRNAGLEWLYRLIREPWRIKRQLVLPKFLFLILRDKLQLPKS